MSPARQPSPLRIALHYAWAYGLHAALRSSRWPASEKIGLVITAGALIAVPVVGAELFWIVTGRGRAVRRVLGNPVIVVVPLGTTKPGARLVEELRRERGKDYLSATASARDSS
jgi:hypothetical protein